MCSGGPHTEYSGRGGQVGSVNCNGSHQQDIKPRWVSRECSVVVLREPEIANTLFGVGQKVRYSLGKNPHTVEQSYMVIRGSRGSYRLVLDVKWVHNSKTKHFSM